MTKRASMLIFNIIVAVILAIAASDSALFALCWYTPEYEFCRHDYSYAILAAVVAAIVLTTYFLHQHIITHNLLQPKRKPRPHVLGQYATFEKTAGLVWNVWKDEKVVKSVELDDLTDVGWIVEFSDDAYPVVVPQAEFFYWLLKVVQTQNKLEADGQRNIASPLSQRSNSSVSRQRLDAYISLLESVNAIEYVNANVKRIKPIYATDVWKYIIKPLEAKKPLVKV